MGSREHEGRVALITGSTSGIGLAIAHALANKGCDIIITGLGKEEDIANIQQTIEKDHGVKTRFMSCDLRHVTEIEAMCGLIDEKYPSGIDILCNNAGFNIVHSIEGYHTEWWDDSVAVMLTAPFHLMRRFLPKMKKKGWGRIVNTSSQHGVISTAGKAVYSAVKHGIIGLTKGVALDIGASNVTANCICPAFADTDVTQKQFEATAKEKGCTPAEAREMMIQQVPNKRMVKVEHIADMVVYLCSDSAVSVTGSAMLMDGGYTAQ